jgi:hypothetical protein
MRSYLRQWIDADWCGAVVELLRMSVDGLTNRAALDDWLDRAIDANIDPNERRARVQRGRVLRQRLSRLCRTVLA